MKPAKSVNMCAASVAIARLLAMMPPATARQLNWQHFIRRHTASLTSYNGKSFPRCNSIQRWQEIVHPNLYVSSYFVISENVLFEFGNNVET